MTNLLAFLKELWASSQGDMGQLGLAGVAGAVAAGLVEWRGFFDFTRKVVVGGLCAMYLSELAVPLLNMLLPMLGVDPSAAGRLGGFIMGILGIMVIEFLLQIMRIRRVTWAADAAQRGARGAPTAKEPEKTPNDTEGLDDV